MTDLCALTSASTLVAEMNESYPRFVKGQRLITVEYGEAAHRCRPTSTTQYYVNSWTDSRNGGENPFYKTQIKQGVNATTGFSGFRQFYKWGGQGNAFVIVKTNPLEICQPIREVRADGYICGFPTLHVPISVPTGDSLSQALGDFNRRAADLLRPVMGAVSAGELNKTLRMIMNPAQALRKGIEDYYKALKKVPRKASPSVRKRALVDTYLEHTFGWMPLWHDMQGGLDALRRFQTKRGVETVAIVGYGQKEFTGFTNPGSVTYGILQIDFMDMTKGKASTKVFGAVRTKSYGADSSIADNLGFYPDNWLPSAWELLPYSFIIDYFTNIGNIIDAWSLVNGRVPWACYVTRVEKATSRIGQQVNTKVLGTTVKKSGISPSIHVLITRTVGRTPLYSTIPSLDFRLPGFGTKPMLNIASLLYSKEVRRPFY